MRRPLSWIITPLVLLPLIGAALPAGAAEVVAVTIDKMRVLRLKQDANTVVVARPDVVNVVLDSPRLLFVYGLSPGETSLHILDSDQKEIMSADVVVTAKTARQVSVHRGPVENTLSCAPRCMGVSTPGAAAAGGGAPTTTAATTGSSAAASGGAATGGGAAPAAPATPAPTTPAPAAPATGSGPSTTR